MATIIEALENAKYNFINAAVPFQKEIAISQIDNAIVLLEKGYDGFVDIEELIKEYGSVENVPEID